ncbi:L-aspartate oxidase [Mangrovimonas sp. CR14]|uniref:L-aspartate oxidase n=1 Tax=Mangrovimonas sp. CR14 TaxID=2706120 RepID=UPI0014222744|nr:L-aspartate oxidase [Mangrovimonas sp. CR14]NIK92647.1 L-aspartate oxidase [Mangrovimonas sp. CR14]
MTKYETDFLILGSGIAGLTCAIRLAQAMPDRVISVVTKANENESNTKYAQGGMAVVWDKLDSFEDHINDTLVAGEFHNNPEVVRMVVEEAPNCLRQLISWGADFDANTKGEIDLGREGGHSAHRIVHHKDITGFEIEKTLLKKVASLSNISMFPYHFAIDLITDHQLGHVTGEGSDVGCYGAYILDQKTNEINRFMASQTILCTGGIGQVYASTTNPLIATGDGIAMAFRAGAKVKDMEFVQFHPTALFEPEQSPSFLISEAVRGFGAYLRNKNGERFMVAIDDRAELAPRDVVARAIDNEINTSGDRFVYLDCRHLNYEAFLKHFPNINEKCLEMGIDIREHMIPVVPASHYACGGIEVDTNGATNLINLYAAGECSCTGLHGANRLASNSLLEALVYANHIADAIIEKEEELQGFQGDVPVWNDKGTSKPKELILITHYRNTIQSIMSDLVGIVRANDRLKEAAKHLVYVDQSTHDLYVNSKLSVQICELRNLNTIASLIVNQSQKQTKNLGGFYNIDLLQ